MIRVLSGEFECPMRRSEDTQWAEFEKFAIQRAYNDKIDIVLLIDEAQTIPRKVLIRLREILNFETDTAKFVQVILFGTLDLWDTLTTVPALQPLRSRISGGVQLLTPLDKKDLTAAIKFRLTVAGRHDQLFEDECFELIHQASRGVLRNAVDLCKLSLEFAFEEREPLISPLTVAIAVEALAKTPESGIGEGLDEETEAEVG